MTAGTAELAITAHGAELSISPASIDFGSQPVGSSESRYLQVTYNAGPGADNAQITGYGGPFSGSATVTSSTTPTALELTFTPTAAQSYGPTTLTLGATFTGAQQRTCALSGTGFLATDAAMEAEEEGDSVHTGKTDARYLPGGVYYNHANTAPRASAKYWEVELDHTAEGKTFNSYLRIGSAEANPVLVGSPAPRIDAAEPRRPARARIWPP